MGVLLCGDADLPGGFRAGEVVYLLPVVAGDRGYDSAGDYWGGGVAVVQDPPLFAEGDLVYVAKIANAVV